MEKKAFSEKPRTELVSYLGNTIQLVFATNGKTVSWSIKGWGIVSAEPTREEAIEAAKRWIASH